MKLKFDQTGSKKFMVGAKNGVLFPYGTNSYNKGVAWDGLRNVNHSPEGGEPTDYYADNIKYFTIVSTENFKGEIGCYYTPEEFDACDGTKTPIKGMKLGQQAKKSFGFAYKSQIGNDTEGEDHGYVLYIIYGCFASPSARDHASINENVEPGELSFSFSSTPVAFDAVEGYKPVSCLELSSIDTPATKMKAIEDIVYGTDDTYKLTTDTTVTSGKKYYTRTGTSGNYVYTEVESPTGSPQEQGYYEVDVPGADPRLPMPNEIYSILNAA